MYPQDHLIYPQSEHWVHTKKFKYTQKDPQSKTKVTQKWPLEYPSSDHRVVQNDPEYLQSDLWRTHKVNPKYSHSQPRVPKKSTQSTQKVQITSTNLCEAKEIDEKSVIHSSQGRINNTDW